jgi:hypothetical protein
MDALASNARVIMRRSQAYWMLFFLARHAYLSVFFFQIASKQHRREESSKMNIAAHSWVRIL